MSAGFKNTTNEAGETAVNEASKTRQGGLSKKP